MTDPQQPLTSTAQAANADRKKADGGAGSGTDFGTAAPPLTGTNERPAGLSLGEPITPSHEKAATLKGSSGRFWAHHLSLLTLPEQVLTYQGRCLELWGRGDLRLTETTAHGHYEASELLGSGGMGTVLAAEERLLGRPVAMKIAHNPMASGPSTLEPFAHEAFMTAQLDHPHVVPIYALARDPAGRVFFTMKRVIGVGWHHLLHPERIRKPEKRAEIQAWADSLTWRDHLDILLKVSDAVAYAHSKSILHRDLKPANVMIGRFGEVLVMDWGLAMYFGPRNEYLLDPDKPPELAGTPAYMAPEMARGEMTRLCAATDIYLLGGILHEVLTGRRPRADRDAETLLQQARLGNIDPLPEQGQARPIDAPLQHILQKAMAPQIEDRYASVAQWQRDLREFLQHAESLAVADEAERMLTVLQSEFGARPKTNDRAMTRAQAVTAYQRLSESVGGFRQALHLWPDNRRAAECLAVGLQLEIRLAIQQNDLTLARSQLAVLGSLMAPVPAPQRGARDAETAGPGPLPALSIGGNEATAAFKVLTAELEQAERRESLMVRRARMWRVVLAALAVLLAVSVVFGFWLLNRQNQLVHDMLRLSEDKQRSTQQDLQELRRWQHRLFVRAIRDHAALVDQNLQEIGRIVALYRSEAQRLMSMPEAQLPFRAVTPAGRDGFYLDAEYEDSATRPADVRYDPRYRMWMSAQEATVVLAPWARAEPDAALADARRLARLAQLFAQVQRGRNDILWSLAGSAQGVLVSFPGSARFGDKPTYDPTTRPWYRSGLAAPDAQPVWSNPHVDAGGQGVVLSCVAPMRSAGRVQGVVGLEVALATLRDSLDDFARTTGPGCQVVLVKPDGHILVDTATPAERQDWTQDYPLPPIATLGAALARYFQAIQAGSVTGDVTLMTMAGTVKTVTHARLRHADWVVIGWMDEPSDNRHASFVP